MTRRQRQSGAVSLFAVIFAMLLITVITVGFIRIMLTDQQQATNNYLSESAYDSAMAGVEDAKRVLALYAKNPTAYAGYIDSQKCNEAPRRALYGSIGSPATNAYDPVPIRQSATSTNTLNQSYTCVIIQPNAPDYQDTLLANTSRLIPLRVEAGKTYTSLTVRWFSKEDVSDTGAVALPLPAARQKLASNWPPNQPPVLRAQFIQFGQQFRLEHFDATMGGNSNVNTLFLAPVRDTVGYSATRPVVLMDRDVRADTIGGEARPDGSGSSPLPVFCKQTVSSAQDYACALTMRLPEPYNMASSGARTAYLRLSAFYNTAHFKVTLSNGAGGTVNFSGVQAVVDSTGRANDVFKRVESRVNLFNTDLPLPEAAVDVAGNLCKDFKVDNTTYYAGSCTP